MACRGGDHDDPQQTGSNSGTDAQGKWWKETRYKCGACGTTWVESEGPGMR